MPAQSNEQQFKFLISCIRYSNNGRVSSLYLQLLRPIDFSRSTSVKLRKSVRSLVRALRKFNHIYFTLALTLWIHCFFLLIILTSIVVLFSSVTPNSTLTANITQCKTL